MRRALWIVLLIFFVLLITGAIFLNIWVNGYLRSEGFRTMIEDKTGLALELKATYAPFQWSGVSVYSDTFSGVASSSDIQAQQIRAGINLRAILEGRWEIDDLQIGRLEATFGGPATSKPTHVAATPMATPIPVPPASPSAFAFLLPTQFALDRVTITDGNFSWGAGTSAAGSVQGSEMVVIQDKNGWNVSGKGGKLVVKGFPEFEITTAQLRAQRGTLYITKGTLTTTAGGTLEVSGERDPDSSIQLNVSWAKVPVQSILPAPWKDRLSGICEGTANFQSKPHSMASVEGNFLLTDGLLQGIPVQDEIANFTRQPQYRRLPIQQFSANYTTKGGRTELTNIIMESKGLLRVEGTFILGADDSLRGDLRVGVTAQSLQWLPGSQSRVFTDSENGYLWTTVHLSGTVQNPKEDLSSRLIAAAAGQVIETGVETGKKLLHQPVETTQDAVKSATDVLKHVLPLP